MARNFGDGSTDYEKYINTAQLYQCMKSDEECVNEDEALFQATHQSMELWLAVVNQHCDQIATWMKEDNARDAARFLRRAANIVNMLIDSLRHLEAMSPWNYHAIRVTLGQGSGQQSPTFNALLAQDEPLRNAYQKLLEKRGVSVDQIQQAPKQHEELYDLISALMTFDENFMRWRYCHFQLVKRIIGDRVMSLAGVPASALKDHAHKAMFPDLWDAISRTTNAYNKAHGAPGLSGAYIVNDED